MKRLGKVLSSGARTEMLRVLYYQSDSIGLRPLARIAGLLPRSAEVAVLSLLEANLIYRLPGSRGPVYVLNRAHPDYDVLSAVFSAATNAIITKRSHKLAGKAQAILPFITAAEHMLSRARESRHVT